MRHPGCRERPAFIGASSWGDGPVTAGERENLRRLGHSLRRRSATMPRIGASCLLSTIWVMADGPLARFFWRAVDAVDYC